MTVSSTQAIRTVAVVGAGLVGASWAIVFARAGLDVLIFDASDAARAAAVGKCQASLRQMDEQGLLRETVETICARIRVVGTLQEAVAAADYVQESVREEIGAKREVAAAIAEFLSDRAVVGSSTSGFPSSSFTEGVKRRAQFLVVHPVNPPHLIPVVEIVPAPWTAPEAVTLAHRLMGEIGQKPVALKREIDGFILNRLQGALLEEAWRLYSAGYASVEDIDTAVSHGLGMRWSFIGPFETIDLNAPGGLADYAKHLAPMYRRIADTRPNAEPWNDEAVAKAHAERRAAVAKDDLPARRDWRDATLLRFLARFREG